MRGIWCRSTDPRSRTHLVIDYLANGVPVTACGAVGRHTQAASRNRCQRCVSTLAFPKALYVYTLHGDSGPLYVGCTSNPYLRTKAHAGRAYWDLVTHVTLVGFDDVTAAADAELAAINELRPPLNRDFRTPYPVHLLRDAVAS